METIQLTPSENDIFNGLEGPVMQKVMASVVMYGNAMGARKLIPITGKLHSVLSCGARMLDPVYEILQELVDAGIKTKAPFTVDPRPMDYENMQYSFAEKLLARFLFSKQNRLESQIRRLGLRDANAFTCACYLPEVGNVPDPGDILCWSESSAVVYVNSILGARSNRNSALIELFCNILGKAPCYGLLTDDGRKADWLIEVNTPVLPEPQLLGSAIGLKIFEGVPLIRGLKPLFDSNPECNVNDYLKDMGASCAASGAVGLYHIEGLTPEAMREKNGILREDHNHYAIDDRELAGVKASYPVLWKNKNRKPKMCIIGCPHLSFHQVLDWKSRIIEALKKKHRKRVSVGTFLCTAPDVVNTFNNDRAAAAELKRAGMTLTTVCPLTYMNNPLSALKPVVTNSGKLRTYTTARYYDNDEILHLITT